MGSTLDNTLLNDDLQITEYTKNIFKKCKEKGYIIVFATARPYRKTRILFDAIKPDAIICHCGGGVYVNEKMFYQNSIKSNVAGSILKIIVKDYPKINIAVECNDEIFTNFDTSICWNGITEPLKHYGVKKEDTISFGDDDVDIEMIEKCGTRIAVKNGNERIKNKAKYICASNNEDGIAKWIEDHIL